MVIEDGCRPKASANTDPQAPAKYSNHHLMALPMDRLGSVIVDLFIVLAPAVTLFSAPLQRLVLESFLLGLTEIIWVSRGGQWLLGIFTLIVYQTIFWRAFGATIGQMFFGLRVVDMHSGNKLSSLAALLRSLVWNAQWIFLLGLTFLTVFSHQFRRSWHDRLADSQVLTVRQRAAAQPSQRDAKMVQGLLAGLGYLLAVFFVYQLFAAFHSFHHGVSSRSSAELREVCMAVDRAMADWPELTRRLEVAMALYAAGSIESECLEPELELARFERKFDGLDYLALAFLHAENPQRSDAYLKAVCAEDATSFSCAQSKIIGAMAKRGIENPGHKASVQQEAPAYFRLWALRQAMKEGDYPSALELIISLKAKNSLRLFLSVEEIKAWWAMGQRSKARNQAEVLVPVVSPIDGFDMASFICAEDAEFSCQRTESPLCQWSYDWISRQPVNTSSSFGDRLALLWLRDWECRAKRGLEEPLWLSESLKDKFLPREAEMLLLSAQYEAEGEQVKAQSLRWELVEREEFALIYRLRALRGIVNRAVITEDLTDAVEFWRGLQLSQHSSYLGWSILGRALEFKNDELAFEIGQKLSQSLGEEAFFQQAMVVASLGQGHRPMAMQWLRRWQDQHKATDRTLRRPASDPAGFAAEDAAAFAAVNSIDQQLGFELRWQGALKQLGAQ